VAADLIRRGEEALAAIEAAGLTFTLTGDEEDRLLARPSDLVTAATASTLRCYKTELLAALRARRDPGERRRLIRAEHFGLSASWARDFGFVSIFDPTTGESYDVPTGEAPGWALGEANRRKGLWKGGDKRAYRYTSQELSEMFKAEIPERFEPAEAVAAMSAKGVIYEDYVRLEDHTGRDAIEEDSE
jgi:hypothetical protein